MNNETTLFLRLPESLLPSYFPLFQEGVELDVEVGCTIRQLLVEQFGIPVEYLEQRITTIFLNSKAVDDAAQAVVSDGSVLALSGAMPGLVGATMRSGGYYAAMRGAMTYNNSEQSALETRGRLTIKLFNLLLPELSPRLLLWGIYPTSEQLQRLIAQFPSDLRLRDCTLDNKNVSLDLLRQYQWQDGKDRTLHKVQIEKD